MAFGDFGLPEVLSACGLQLAAADLFCGIPPLSLPSDVTERMRAGVDLALAATNTRG